MLAAASFENLTLTIHFLLRLASQASDLAFFVSDRKSGECPAGETTRNNCRVDQRGPTPSSEASIGRKQVLIALRF